MGLVRFFLALSVAVLHIPGGAFQLLYAAAAVTCFFIISGFYMAMVLTERYDRAGEFYWARFTRLYPAYFTMAVVMVAWFWWTGSPNAFTGPLVFSGQAPVTWWENVIHGLLNVFVFGQDLFELVDHSPAAPIRALFSADFFNSLWMLVGQAWSLSTEAFFYLMAPFVVRSPVRTAAMLAIGLAVRVTLLGILGWPWFWGYYFPIGSACFFFMGSLAYHLYRRLKFRHSRALCVSLGGILLAWVLGSIVTRGIALPPPPPPSSSIDGIEFWVFYLLFAALVPLLFEATKRSRYDGWIGELSYPLYLVHGLVQGIFFFTLGARGDHVPTMLAALSCSVAAAIVMRLVVEWPIERWRRRAFPRKTAVA
jgi:peptidoglycan/LPS O-acetylase OafA/YrhL